MKAIEVTGTIQNGKLLLDQPLEVEYTGRVQVTVLIPESETDEDEPREKILEDVRQGLYEAITGQTIPLSQMWESLTD
ncbi:type II toxin-antitoxin system RelN family antitoxin [Leptolyngbya sp. AN03gr2]|uniref:type II toxin-antitoxin system RelN family antitoxin n=1 Tax=unclassified Leptolyngbya TaxID=2650499 RepID=UPI003D311335